MRFIETPIPGAVIVEPEPRNDHRGSFMRTFCAEEFRAQGLAAEFVQCSTSWNARRGTLRGLHYQIPPYEEAKLVRVTRGAVFDVAVDLRPDSPRYLHWTGVELTAENRRALYIPPGCAHGFQTLEDETEVFYQISVPYRADASRGIRWDDPALGVRWPLPEPVMSERDRTYPDWSPAPAARCRGAAGSLKAGGGC